MSSQPMLQEEHRCSACSSALQFDPESKTLYCAACDETRQPEVAEARPASNSCPNCGAALTTITGARQAKCDACDSTFQILQDLEDCGTLGEIPQNHRFIIPFSVDREAYQKGMISWMAEAPFTPGDAFSKMAMIHGAKGVYLPYYFCVSTYKVQWTASIGYDRVETYVVHETRRDANGKTTTVPVTRTRIVTDWRPHSANASGSVTLCTAASGHFEQVSKRVDMANTAETKKGILDSAHGRTHPLGDMHVIPATKSYQLGGAHGQLQAFDTKYTASFDVLACDVPSSQAYDKNAVHRHIEEDIKRNAPGDRIRDLRFSGDIIPDYFLVYRPFWKTVYSYEKKVCATHGDGTNAALHYGTRPIDKGRKKLAARLLIPFWISLLVSGVLGIWGLFAQHGLPESMVNVLIGALIGTGVFGIVGGVLRAIVKGKGRSQATENAQQFLENPSLAFGRKSAMADPLAGNK